MPLLDLDHYPQEEQVGCLAACAQMVLAYSNLHISQATLNRLLGLIPQAGVPFPRLERLDRRGVSVAILKDGTIADLMQAVDQNMPLIVCVHTDQLSYWQESTQHAIVVCGYDDTHIFVNDPAFSAAPQAIPTAELMLAWDEFDNTYATLTR